MKILGVELTGSDAVICLLSVEGETYNLPDLRVRKLTLTKQHTRKDLQKFQFEFSKLLTDYKVNLVVIKERMTKGKFAGGAISFKLESAIQLIPEVKSILIPSTKVKVALAAYPIPIAFVDTGLKVFQEAAFKVAYASNVIRTKDLEPKPAD